MAMQCSLTAIPPAVFLNRHRVPGARLSTADAEGVYLFADLRADQYTLKLSSPGFLSLTIKSISVVDGENKSIPPLELTVSASGCDGSHLVDNVRLLSPGARVGSLGGTVKLDLGPMLGNTPPVARAKVELICGRSTICGVAKTNSKGEFLFENLRPGQVTLRVNRVNFYPLQESGFKVQEGLELIYYPIYIERCFHGNCDPKLRPKKPLAVCE